MKELQNQRRRWRSRVARLGRKFLLAFRGLGDQSDEADTEQHWPVKEKTFEWAE